MLNRYFQSIGKQISRCVNDIIRLQKTTEYCGRVRECRKVSLITYLNSWKYWYIA